jgi:hypothetical protein
MCGIRGSHAISVTIISLLGCETVEIGTNVSYVISESIFRIVDRCRVKQLKTGRGFCHAEYKESL